MAFNPHVKRASGQKHGAADNDVLMDVALFTHPTQLKEGGAMLLSVGEKEGSGVVVFSVVDLAMHTVFTTERGHFLRRTSSHEFSLTSSDGEHYFLLPILSENNNNNNNDDDDNNPNDNNSNQQNEKKQFNENPSKGSSSTDSVQQRPTKPDKDKATSKPTHERKKGDEAIIEEEKRKYETIIEEVKKKREEKKKISEDIDQKTRKNEQTSKGKKIDEENDEGIDREDETDKDRQTEREETEPQKEETDREGEGKSRDEDISLMKQKAMKAFIDETASQPIPIERQQTKKTKKTKPRTKKKKTVEAGTTEGEESVETHEIIRNNKTLSPTPKLKRKKPKQAILPPHPYSLTPESATRDPTAAVLKETATDPSKTISPTIVNPSTPTTIPTKKTRHLSVSSPRMTSPVSLTATTPTSITESLRDIELDLCCIDTVRFEAQMKILGGKTCKTTIVLNKEKMKIQTRVSTTSPTQQQHHEQQRNHSFLDNITVPLIKTNKTIVKERYGSFAALADVADPLQFTLIVKRKSYHFVSSSHVKRDEILSTIRTFTGDNARRTWSNRDGLYLH